MKNNFFIAKQVITQTLNAILLCCLPSLVYAETNSRSLGSNVSARKALSKSWHDRLKYSVSLRRATEDVTMPTSPLPDSELFPIDLEPLDITFSAGGNLFEKTSIFGEISYNQFDAFAKQRRLYYIVDSNQIKADLLVERDFDDGISFGADLFYADRSDKYHTFVQAQEQTMEFRHSDDFESWGSDLMAAKTFYQDNYNVRLHYNFSVWTLDRNGSVITRKYHGVAASLYNQWTPTISTSISVQGLYFPGHFFVVSESINHAHLYSAEISYRLKESTEISLGAERLTFGARSDIVNFSLRIEYQFGVTKTKRRKRRYKVPTSLYRIRGLAQ